MPNPIYIQERANPWEAMLPQLLGNLFLAKVKHGWDMETAADETYQKALTSGKFSSEPTETAKPIGLSENPMFEQQKPTATIAGKPLYRIPTTIKEGQVLGRDALIKTGAEGTDVTFAPATEGWKPRTKEEAMEVRASGKADSEPTFSKIEGNVFFKWSTDQLLSPKEQSLVDRKFKESGQDPTQVKENAKARISAKVETFKELMKREPSSDELRSMIVNDPYGILAPNTQNPSGGSGGGGAVPPKNTGESVTDYLKRIGG